MKTSYTYSELQFYLAVNYILRHNKPLEDKIPDPKPRKEFIRKELMKGLSRTANLRASTRSKKMGVAIVLNNNDGEIFLEILVDPGMEYPDQYDMPFITSKEIDVI